MNLLWIKWLRTALNKPNKSRITETLKTKADIAKLAISALALSSDNFQTITVGKTSYLLLFLKRRASNAGRNESC